MDIQDFIEHAERYLSGSFKHYRDESEFNKICNELHAKINSISHQKTIEKIKDEHKKALQLECTEEANRLTFTGDKGLTLDITYLSEEMDVIINWNGFYCFILFSLPLKNT